MLLFVAVNSVSLAVYGLLGAAGVATTNEINATLEAI